MNQQKLNTTKIIITLVCIIFIVVSVIAIVFTTEVILNKSISATFNDLDSTEKKLFDVLSGQLASEDGAIEDFNIPVVFIKDKGICRGRGFSFNVKVTESEYDFGLNGGTYGAEIILPDKHKDLPTVYRLSTFAPDLGSFLFPSDYTTVKLGGKTVYVIAYDDDSLSDGSFITLFEQMKLDYENSKTGKLQ